MSERASLNSSSASELLRGRSFTVSGSGVGADYAACLLRRLAARVVCEAGDPEPHPDLQWAACGAMALTGWPEASPLLAPAPLAACAQGALLALRCVAGASGLESLEAAALLGERAAILGLSRQGSISPGGGCRLLPTADGWFAVNLARPDDVRLLPAWLGEGKLTHPWGFVAERAVQRPSAELVERGRLLGLAVAAVERPSRLSPPWLRVMHRGKPRPESRAETPLVIDLSSLWAGPLCTHLLARAGARVIKLESLERPDGTRSGPREFFDLMHAGHRSVALDFSSDQGRQQLVRLLRAADIVVESSRPRALRQLGVQAEKLVEEVPGLTWVGISGYGRREPGANWTAFGDDASVAAGLTVATPDAGAPVFCGDAIADPLTGLHAAVAALASWSAGGGQLLDLSLRDVAAHVLGFSGPSLRANVRSHAAGWEVTVDGKAQLVQPARARAVSERGPELGADTEAVLRELAIPC